MPLKYRILLFIAGINVGVLVFVTWTGMETARAELDSGVLSEAAVARDWLGLSRRSNHPSNRLKTRRNATTQATMMKLRPSRRVGSRGSLMCCSSTHARPAEPDGHYPGPPGPAGALERGSTGCPLLAEI